MTANIETPRSNIWRIVGWGGAVALILTPLVAMQFTEEVKWTGSDFVFAAIIFGTVGGLIELAMRKSSNLLFRLGAVLAILSGFVVVWVNAAVGMIGDDHPVTLLFGLVLVAAMAGPILSRTYKNAMPAAMLFAGLVQAAIGLFAGVMLGIDPRGGVLTIVLACPWLISAALLRAAKPS